MRLIERLTAFSFDHPRLVLFLALLVTTVFAASSPRARVDTDPENMLEADQPDRVRYDRMKRDFNLHDMIVVGVVDRRGIYHPEALGRIARVVAEIQEIPGVITQDIVSLTTTNNPTAAGGVVDIRPVMERVPRDEAEMAALRRAISENRFLNEKIV
ncbi:MAG: hypothetical protein HY568_06755, partial [Candidatus Latescibacteria bacterium]|nr:hypothetical protein [Candidatus Latescibacterota bacterium]